MTGFSIGELARAAEVPASTVRYYERQGLLHPDGRSSSNYRVYGAHSLRRLRFIRAAQRHGFRLREIHQLLDLKDGSADCCGEVKSIIEARLKDLQRDLVELTRVRGVLADALRWCQRDGPEGPCPVLEELDQGGPEAGRG